MQITWDRTDIHTIYFAESVNIESIYLPCGFGAGPLGLGCGGHSVEDEIADVLAGDGGDERLEGKQILVDDEVSASLIG